ncbi:MCP four helix bundle domain-containing protein [Methylobacter sp.]|uniref:MCP four helix bundle domain-containing protein n=1 Tax=Methylobacter sp. TaxID=2051955 RepID=UPI002FDDD935
MEPNTTKSAYAFLPWVLTFALLGALTVFSYYRESDNPFEMEFKKADLLSTMRIHLLEAIEAEKNAVMATTDEASESFAVRSRQAADKVESNRKEIESIIDQQKLPREIEILNNFNICWAQFRKLDETILALATQNTNLKAQKISATQGAQEMERFEQSLNRLIHRNAGNNRCNTTVMLSYEALTAGLKIFSVHQSHIEEADDQEMDKIELSIKSYDISARKALGSLSNITGLKDSEDLKNAETAYEQFMNLTDEVLRLSRMNTNIKSAELSLGGNELISSQCQEILADLQETIQARQFKATR